WTLMLSTNNLLSPANSHPVVTPSQDIVLGIYYLTDMIEGYVGEDKYFDDMTDVLRAVDHRQVRYRTRINYLMDGEFIQTTPGRLIFNGILPKDFPFVNTVITDKVLSEIIAKTFRQFGPTETVRMLDDIKETGYKFATFFAPTISVSDIIVPTVKKNIIEEEDRKVVVIENEYRNGFITDEERYNRVINLWTEANELIGNEMFKAFEADMHGHNPVFIMAKSGARGSKQQIGQLAGMRGLMAKPSGEIIEVPIRANFKEGLTVLEYFISTNGARKGLADTALKTADAGYLTRRLVDIAQDVVINHEDCGTTVGIDILPIKEGDMVIESLGARVLGRTLLYDLVNPVTGEILAKSDEIINEDIANIIDEIEIDSIEIRSVLTCESKHGVCAKCYGRNLATSRHVEIGEAVGIIAAQSIGQPGTQLTMRTFHIGGIASRSVEESEIKFNYPIFINNITSKMIKTEGEKIITVRRGYIVIQRIIFEVEYKPRSEFFIEDGEKVYAGKVFAQSPSGDEYKATNTGMLKIDKKKAYIIGEPYSIPINVGTEIVAELEFDKKSGVFSPVQKPYQSNEIIANFDPWFEPILTEIYGRVEFVDVELNKSLIEEIDAATYNKKRVIVEYKTEKLQPRINIYGSASEPTTYLLPKGANLMVENGSNVNAGVVLAKIPRSAEKTKDITGGLPRVAELFEARTPKDAATLTAIDGIVTIGDTAKNKRKIIITAEDGTQKEYSIPVSKFLRVQDKDWLSKGEKIDDGPVDPHEILKIKGPRELQKFLVNEILEVYRLQGVSINDKHIEVIVRQMLRKVRVTDQGDSNFVIEQVVDKFDFIEENERVLSEGGKVATAIPVLMGITKAALNTESFISAASFQETTRVLTEAAIKGKIDYLRGLKENVIIGHLIPAGTGIRSYDKMSIYQETMGDLDEAYDADEYVEEQSAESAENVESVIIEDKSIMIEDQIEDKIEIDNIEK
ncbi:MAG: DNA-directed RNA polymerase subunit beta', partial [Leptospirales bacterium]|nr:DNA-directed RNA polymerase subunit beta' [Leptospirales bacterium]